MNHSDDTSKRNIGIDALRILAMFMIVVLHLMGKGGLQEHVAKGTAGYYLAWILECLCLCAVDAYALVSGYVGWKTEFRYQRVLKVWMQTLFYSLIFLGIFALRMPESVTTEEIKKAIFPVTTVHYWYITAYVGMCLFVPFLNAGIQKLEEGQLKLVILLAALFGTVFPLLVGTRPWNLQSGYSVLWLTLLYLIGGCLGRLNLAKKCSGWKALLLYLMGCGLTFVLAILGKESGTEYTSPTVLLAAVGLLLFLAGRKMESERLRKVILLLAPATLGVYLIHTNSLIWENRMAGVAAPFAEDNAFIMLVKVLLLAVAIYIGGTIIELLRRKLFGLCKRSRSKT